MKQCPKCNAQYSDDQAVCPIDATVLVDTKGNQVNVDPMLGRVIADKYRIEKLIGRGGMGAVYEGQHMLLDRRVAIKVLQQNMANDEQAATRFIREAKACARIEHPNAVTIYDFGVLQEGSAYLVMEFIKGYSLRQLMMQQKPLTPEQIAEWMIQVCNVVEAAHQQGIIHRDLKPENVMLKETPDGSVIVKVVDFGLAKITSESGSEKASTNLTKPGEMLGTPHYMAPEYYEGETIDNRADIYAIGIMMYELFCGDTPFTGTVQSIIGGHLFKDPQPIINFNPSIHPALDQVVQKALKKKREERIASASELTQELKKALKVAREFFFQKTDVQTPLEAEEFKAGSLDSEQQTSELKKDTLFQADSPQILKTEKVIPASHKETTKIQEIPSQNKLTQQMNLEALESLGIGLEAKTPEANKAVPATQKVVIDDVISDKPTESSFTSASTLPQPPVVAGVGIAISTPNKVINPVPNTQPITPPSVAPNQLQVQIQSTTNAPQTGELKQEYETLSDVLSALKGQLIIGSIIVVLLAIMVSLLVIYRLEVH